MMDARRTGLDAAAALSAACLLMFSGCSSGGGEDGPQCSQTGALAEQLEAKMIVREGGSEARDTYVIDASAVAGTTQTYTFTIRNEAAPIQTAAQLKITGVELIETNESGATAEGQFTCTDAAGDPCADAGFAAVVPDNPAFDLACADDGAQVQQEVRVGFTPPASGPLHQAKLRIYTEGDPSLGPNTPFEVAFEALAGTPRLTCAAQSAVELGNVPVGGSAEDTLVCTNTGNAKAVVSRIEWFSQDSPPVSATFKDVNIVDLDTPFEGEPPLEVLPGQQLIFDVAFSGLTKDTRQSATLRISTNNVIEPVISVQYIINGSGPCLKVEPSNVAFGDSPVGLASQREINVSGCGTSPVVITGIALNSDSAASYALDFSTGDFAGDEAPTEDAPLTLNLGGTGATLRVLYEPTAAGTPEAGAITFTYLDAEGTGSLTKEAVVTGTGAEAVCPTACITFAGGTAPPGGKPPDEVGDEVQAIPQSGLQFSAACSSAAAGQQIASYAWKLSQPSGSSASLSPSAAAEKITFAPTVTGEYLLSLEVTDSLNTPSCTAAELLVRVVPDNKLFVELTWVTPGDDDETDDAGADLDLHLAHPLASKVCDQPDLDKNGEPDPWCAPCYDAFLVNKTPDWGQSGNALDDPGLDLDDGDGAGPENTSIPVPETDLPYTIGVYYWDDNGFGPSVPKVRIYLDGELAWEKKGPQMVTGDMWCVASASWRPDDPDYADNIQPCPGADDDGVLLTKKYPFCSPLESYECEQAISLCN